MSEKAIYLKGVGKNISSNFIRTIITFIISFTGSIIYTRTLGQELYGAYTYMLWFTGTISIFVGFGYESTITKFLPEYYFNDKREEGKDFLRYVLRRQIINVFFITLLLLFSLPMLKVLLKTEQYKNVNILFVISIISILPTVLLSLTTNSIQALHEFVVYARVSIVAQVILFIISVCLALFTKRIELMLIGMLVLLMYQVIQYYLCLKRHLQIGVKDIFGFRGKFRDKNRIKRYARIIYVNVLTQQIVWTKSEFFFLGIYASAKDVALYGLAYSLLNMISTGVNTIMSVLNNYFSVLVSKKEDDLLKKIIFYVIKYFAVLLIPMFFYALVFFKPLVILIYSNKYVGIWAIFPIMFLGYIISQLVNVPGGLPFFYEKQKLPTYIGIAAGIANIGLDMLLIPKYGILGAAVANFAAQVICSLVTFIYNYMTFKLRFPKKDVIKILIVSAVSYILLDVLIYNIMLKIIIGIILVASYYKILKVIKVINTEDYKMLKVLKSGF